MRQLTALLLKNGMFPLFQGFLVHRTQKHQTLARNKRLVSTPGFLQLYRYLWRKKSPINSLEISISQLPIVKNVFFKWANPASFSVFWSFQTNNNVLSANQCEKCNVHPVYGARIQTHDLLNISRLP